MAELEGVEAADGWDAGRPTVTLQCRDALEALAECPDDSFDLAIVDPPYGASTVKSWTLPTAHGLPGFGGAWKLASHEWDMLNGLDGFQFTLAYLTELKRVVKPTGSLFVHSTYHNSGIVNVCCQILKIEIINDIVWYKRNAFPNLANRRLTASHESITWAHTGEKERRYVYNAETVKAAEFPGDNLKAGGKQMRTVWDVPNNKEKSELAFGKHPTQKPLRLSARLLTVAGQPGGRVLVPFAGAGTEIIASLRYGMSVTSYEIDEEFFALASKRIHNEGFEVLS